MSSRSNTTCEVQLWFNMPSPTQRELTMATGQPLEFYCNMCDSIPRNLANEETWTLESKTYNPCSFYILYYIVDPLLDVWVFVYSICTDYWIRTVSRQSVLIIWHILFNSYNWLLIQRFVVVCVHALLICYYLRSVVPYFEYIYIYIHIYTYIHVLLAIELYWLLCIIYVFIWCVCWLLCTLVFLYMGFLIHGFGTGWGTMGPWGPWRPWAHGTHWAMVFYTRDF